MKINWEYFWAVLGLLLLIAVIGYGIFVIVDEIISYERVWNNGYCQICNESVIPVAHAYTTDYYCINCKRYNQ
jgi:hypothetical protein